MRLDTHYQPTTHLKVVRGDYKALLLRCGAVTYSQKQRQKKQVKVVQIDEETLSLLSQRYCNHCHCPQFMGQLPQGLHIRLTRLCFDKGSVRKSILREVIGFALFAHPGSQNWAQFSVLCVLCDEDISVHLCLFLNRKRSPSLPLSLPPHPIPHQ